MWLAGMPKSVRVGVVHLHEISADLRIGDSGEAVFLCRSNVMEMLLRCSHIDLGLDARFSIMEKGEEGVF